MFTNMRPFVSTLCFCLALIIQTFAQPYDLDSLRSLLSQADSDTAKARILTQISGQLIWTDWSQVDEAKELAFEASKLLIDKPYSASRGNLSTVLGKIYRYNRQLDSAKFYLYRGISEAKIHEDLSSLSTLTTQLGGVFSDQSQYDSAIVWYEKALEVDKARNIPRMIAGDYLNLANAWSSLDSLNKSLKFFKKGIHILKGKPSHDLANVYSNLGILFYQMGQYDSTTYYFIEARNIWEKVGDPYYVAVAGLNLGTVFTQIKNFEKARIYYAESAPIFDSLENKGSLARVYNNLASLIREYNDPDSIQKSTEIHFKALAVREEIKDSAGMASSLNNIGGNYIDLKKADEALPYLEKALSIKRKLGISQGESQALYNLGLAYYSTQSYPKAKAYFTESLNRSKEISSPADEKIALQGLSDVSYQMGDFQKAYDYRLRFQAIEDSLFNLNKAGQIEELETKYQTEKKEAMINKMAQEKKMAELRIRNQTNQIISLIALLGLGGIITFLFFQRNKLQHRQRLNQQMIEQQEIRLQSIIETQEKERGRIARDLHDGLGQLLSATRMQLAAIKSDSPILPMLDEAVGEVRAIAHTMMPISLQEQGLSAAIEELLSKTLAGTNIQWNFEEFGLKERLPQQIEISLYRITQELVSNSIRHAEASKIEVQLSQVRDRILLTVEDDGKGIAEKDYYTGMGMANIQSRLASLDGGFRIEPGPKKGTIATVRISFPS